MDFRKVNVWPVILLGLLIFLQLRLWFQPGGIVDMMRLKKQLAIELQTNDNLRKRNQALLLQVKGIQKNQDAIETRARQELGMIKKGETFYQVVNEK